MQISAHVKDGYLAFRCEGVLLEPLEKVVLRRDTHMFRLVFRDSEEVELDCPVDDETFRLVGGNRVCGFGFFVDGALLGSSLVPFEVV